MKRLLLLSALSMPIVAWFSNQGAFGPDNGTMSDRYPTLLVAAGYAFAIWALIFALDLWHGIWQSRNTSATLSRSRLPTLLGFALTAAWMPVFSQGWFWLALLVIWSAAALLFVAAWQWSSQPGRSASEAWSAWLPLSLHSGWLSVAAFLNTAQVIVAYRLLDTTDMQAWSAALLAAAGVTILVANHALRGNPPYAAAAIWGLAGIYVKQSASPLPGASTAAWMAVSIATLLLLQTIWLLLRRR